MMNSHMLVADSDITLATVIALRLAHHRYSKGQDMTNDEVIDWHTVSDIRHPAHHDGSDDLRVDFISSASVDSVFQSIRLFSTSNIHHEQSGRGAGSPGTTRAGVLDAGGETAKANEEEDLRIDFELAVLEQRACEAIAGIKVTEKREIENEKEDKKGEVEAGGVMNKVVVDVEDQMYVASTCPSCDAAILNGRAKIVEASGVLKEEIYAIGSVKPLVETTAADHISITVRYINTDSSYALFFYSLRSS